MAQINTVAGMVTELVGRFRNLEPGHAAVTVYATWRDLCEETNAWRYRLIQDTTLDARWFTLALPATIHADIQMIYAVYMNGTGIDLSQVDYSEPPTLKMQNAGAAAETGAAPTQDLTSGSGLNVVVSLLPWLNDPLAVPTAEFGRYHAAIYEGCCARLALEFPQTYADAATCQYMAASALQRYNTAKTKIRMMIEQLNTSQQLMTQSPYPFFTNY